MSETIEQMFERHKREQFNFFALILAFGIFVAGVCAGTFMERDNECKAAWRLHPLAASAVESWKKGNLTERELTRYLTLPQSKNFPLAACLAEEWK